MKEKQLHVANMYLYTKEIKVNKILRTYLKNWNFVLFYRTSTATHTHTDIKICILNRDYNINNNNPSNINKILPQRAAFVITANWYSSWLVSMTSVHTHTHTDILYFVINMYKFVP